MPAVVGAAVGGAAAVVGAGEGGQDGAHAVVGRLGPALPRRRLAPLALLPPLRREPAGPARPARSHANEGGGEEGEGVRKGGRG